VIGQATAIAAALKVSFIPPIPLIEKDIERVERELSDLLQRARDLAVDLEQAEQDASGPAQARRILASARLNEIRQNLSLAHCALIPHEDPRKAAARRTAEYIRKKAPPLVLLEGGQGHAA
jgi:hypothetical protein